MAMTGVYAGTSDPVTVTAAIETLITDHFEQDMSYDGYEDVEFCCCSDGMVIDVPVIGAGWDGSHFPLMISYRRLRRESTQYETDLKAIYDAVTPGPDKRRSKYEEILALP